MCCYVDNTGIVYWYFEYWYRKSRNLLNKNFGFDFNIVCDMVLGDQHPYN